jgi:hypothetical protein
MANMNVITIEQLDKSGNVWRTFTLHKWDYEVDAALERTYTGYNMDRTRVTVN